MLPLLLGLGLVLTAVPYGGNRPLPWALSTALFGGLLLLAVTTRRRDRQPAPRALVFCWGMLLVWIALQLVPGVPLADDSPWRQVAESGVEVPWPVVTLSPARSIDNAMRLLGYWAAGLAAWIVAGRRRDAEAMLRILFLVAVAEAGYALVRALGEVDPLSWLDERGPPGGSVTGTFVNRNHFATFVGLGLLVGGTMLLRETGRLGTATSLRERFAALLDALLGRRWYLAPGLVILCGALFASGSRGGVSATLVGFATLVLAAVRSRHLPASALAPLLGIFGLLVVGVFLLTGDPLEARFAETGGFDPQRLAIYRLALAMAAERPWSGWGYGTFELVFSLHRDARFDLIWDRAHDTYLEHLVELGIPGFVLLYGGYAWILACLLDARGGLLRTRDALFPALGLAAFALVGTHALVDFSIQIPAVALLFAMICGICLRRSVAVEAASDRRQAASRGTPE